MRSFCLLAILFLQATLSFSQEKFLPSIKKGGIFNYQVSVNGQQFPIQMKIDSISPDYNRFKWSMSDGSEGYVTNTKPSLETAIRGFGRASSGEDQAMPRTKAFWFFQGRFGQPFKRTKSFHLTSNSIQSKISPQMQCSCCKTKW
jgi:hypothetical protein